MESDMLLHGAGPNLPTQGTLFGVRVCGGEVAVNSFLGLGGLNILDNGEYKDQDAHGGF